jgi:hypothetical protein
MSSIVYGMLTVSFLSIKLVAHGDTFSQAPVINYLYSFSKEKMSLIARVFLVFYDLIKGKKSQI